jgi:hypothetical protein
MLLSDIRMFAAQALDSRASISRSDLSVGFFGDVSGIVEINLDRGDNRNFAPRLLEASLDSSDRSWLESLVTKTWGDANTTELREMSFYRGEFSLLAGNFCYSSHCNYYLLKGEKHAFLFASNT